MRRDDVRRDAAFDQPDGVMRPAEQRILRQRHAAQAPSARRAACRWPIRPARETTNARRARRREPHAQHAARRGAEPVVGRLAVDQESHAVRRAARWRRARRRCRAPRRRRTAARSASRPRRAAARRPPPAPPGCPSRRTTPRPNIMPCSSGSERTAARSRSASRRRPAAAASSRAKTLKRPSVDRLLGDVVAALRRNAASHAPTSPSRPVVESMSTSCARRDRIDGHLLDASYRIHRSSSVRASVFSSRYLTMTGVASDRPHSRPAPTVTAARPGTTTAPSGTTSG